MKKEAFNRFQLIFPVLFLYMVSIQAVPAIGISTLETGGLSPEEKEGLIRMREEEKLARDIYRSFFDKWNTPVFSRIGQSEQRHTLAIKSLLDQYNLEDPVSNGAGKFSDPDLQKTYDEWVAMGSKSLEDAFRVGAMIEDLDISDLDRLIEGTQNEDIRSVYRQLNRASENHLRRFITLLGESNTTYQPIHLNEARFAAIIDSEAVRGGQGNGVCKLDNGRGKMNANNGRSVGRKGTKQGRGGHFQNNQAGCNADRKGSNCRRNL